MISLTSYPYPIPVPIARMYLFRVVAEPVVLFEEGNQALHQPMLTGMNGFTLHCFFLIISIITLNGRF